jgi:hypothetical protein
MEAINYVIVPVFLSFVILLTAARLFDVVRVVASAALNQAGSGFEGERSLTLDPILEIARRNATPRSEDE